MAFVSNRVIRKPKEIQTSGSARNFYGVVSLCVARLSSRNGWNAQEMIVWFDRSTRSTSFLRIATALWLGAGIVLPVVAVGAEPSSSSNWGSGYYRLNPSKDRPFTAEPRLDSGRFDFDSAPNGRKLGRNSEPEVLERGVRDLPSDGYARSRKRYDRPWGEVPPEWRNEDLDQWPPTERRPRGRPRELPYYDGLQNDRPWSGANEESYYTDPDPWDYPYDPNRGEYRRREEYPPAPDVDEERFRYREPRRRDPYYRYDGGYRWW